MVRKVLIVLILFFLISVFISAEDRFPRPEFKTEYIVPGIDVSDQYETANEYLDVIILFLALCFGSWILIKKRSRKLIFWLSVFSLLYFGFWRKGCICSIGSIQNIVSSFFFPEYIISIFVIIVFFLPLIFSLFFGRVFCSGICPIGAIQDLVAVKPIRLPVFLEKVLSLFPYLYLGISILSAVTGSGFLICRFDPFVHFFRMTGKLHMMIAGLAFIIIGIFIARPYCRFLCPYGVLLRITSFFSRDHFKVIEPDNCINCGLCEQNCPVDAIKAPVPVDTGGNRKKGPKRVLLIFLIGPVFIFLSGWVFSGTAPLLSKINSDVRLLGQLKAIEKITDPGILDDINYFKKSDRTIEDLTINVLDIVKKYYLGSWIFGFFISFVIMIKILINSVRRESEKYSIDRINCLSCARCGTVCPKAHNVHKGHKDSKNFKNENYRI